MNRLVAFFAFIFSLIACTLLGHYLWQNGDGPSRLLADITKALPPGVKPELHYNRVHLSGEVDDPAQLDGLGPKLEAMAGVHAVEMNVQARPAVTVSTAPGKILLAGRVRDAAEISALQERAGKAVPGIAVDISGLKQDGRTLPLTATAPLPVMARLAALRPAALQFTAPAAGQPAKLTGSLPEAGWPEFTAALEKDITKEKADALMKDVSRSADTVLPANLPPPAKLSHAVSLAHQLQGGALELKADGILHVKGIAAPEIFAAVSELRVPGMKIHDLRKLPTPMEGELEDASNTLRLHGTVSSEDERQAVLQRLKALRPDLTLIADGLRVEPALVPIMQDLATAEPGQTGPFSALPPLKKRPAKIAGRIEESTLILEGEVADADERAAVLKLFREMRPDLKLKAEGLMARSGVESIAGKIESAQPGKAGPLEHLPDLRRGVEIRFTGPGAMVQPSLKGFVPPDLAKTLSGAAQRGAGLAPAEAVETLHVSALATTDPAAGGWPIPTPAALEQLILRTSVIEAGGFEVDARGLHLHGSATDEQVAALVAIDVKPVKKVTWAIKVPDAAPPPADLSPEIPGQVPPAADSAPATPR